MGVGVGEVKVELVSSEVEVLMSLVVLSDPSSDVVLEVLDVVVVPVSVLDLVIELVEILEPERVLDVELVVDELLLLLLEVLLEVLLVLVEELPEPELDEELDMLPLILDEEDDDIVELEARDVEVLEVVTEPFFEARIASTVTPPITATVQLGKGASVKPAYKVAAHS